MIPIIEKIISEKQYFFLSIIFNIIDNTIIDKEASCIASHHFGCTINNKQDLEDLANHTRSKCIDNRIVCDKINCVATYILRDTNIVIEYTTEYIHNIDVPVTPQLLYVYDKYSKPTKDFLITTELADLLNSINSISANYTTVNIDKRLNILTVVATTIVENKYTYD